MPEHVDKCFHSNAAISAERWEEVFGPGSSRRRHDKEPAPAFLDPVNGKTEDEVSPGSLRDIVMTPGPIIDLDTVPKSDYRALAVLTQRVIRQAVRAHAIKFDGELVQDTLNQIAKHVDDTKGE